MGVSSLGDWMCRQLGHKVCSLGDRVCRQLREKVSGLGDRVCRQLGDTVCRGQGVCGGWDLGV